MTFFRSFVFSFFGFLILMGYSNATYAGNQNDAARVCQKATFDSDRMACLRELRGGHYFDDRALRICARLDFSSSLPICMRTVKNKYYEVYEVRECRRQNFDSDKVECLREFGHYGAPSYPPPPEPPYYEPYPPHDPGYGDITAPGITRRWIEFDNYKVGKFNELRTIYLRGQYVNEVQLTTTKENLLIESVIVYLTNGDVLSLRELTGRLRENHQKNARLDRRYSLRVDKIEITATSPNIIGSRGKLKIEVGVY